MSSDPEIIRRIILEAFQAMQRGDRQTARRLAENACKQAPDSEEPWLILAALSGPQTSVKYLERALRINPKSERARKGMHWAAERLRHERPVETYKREVLPARKQKDVHPASEVTQKNVAVSAITEPKTQPRRQQIRDGSIEDAVPGASRVPTISRSRLRWPILLLFIIIISASLGWVFWSGNGDPILAALDIPESFPVIPGLVTRILPPTSSPLPAPSGTQFPTFTYTSTYTSTSTQTYTSTPTETPSPTFTPWPTDTPIPPPTDTYVAWPTDTPEQIVDPGDGESDRWIDVNLSEQMLYAYEGNSVVAAFLVSTGVAQFPTVTGQFNTYVKYTSTLMAGDGYYLPDVPYTMYFYKGYGIHGTYWHNNFGTPMSHGCVNMYTPDAEWLYYWAPLGTLVNIHY
jgi:lipoprotein-anchoring transpeptidase ErfK/SrfK